MNTDRSLELYEESKKITPCGVSSPVRVFKPFPLFISSGKGSRITDADGNQYIDFCMAYGPLITGHANPIVMKAAKEQIERGTVYGAPSDRELELLKRINARVPCAENVRLTNSGTEATMHAVRLARGFTNKRGIVKMNRGFHGAHDSMLAISGSAEHCIPSSAGVPEDTVRNTYIVEYNNAPELDSLLQKNNDIAAVIMEPVMGNIGVVPPKKGYLDEIRKITLEHDVLLIFDEVITGFRVSGRCAQGLFGITPDLCTLGKIIGGGFPVGAIAGKEEIMQHLAPAGPVYEAGTFSGNPVTAAAGSAVLDILSEEIYSELKRRTDTTTSAINDLLTDRNVKGCIQSSTSMFQIFFGTYSVTNGTDIDGIDLKMFEKMFNFMLKSGIYLPPSPLEVNFLSTAHDDSDVNRFIDAFDLFLRSIRS
ncbi:MAG: glutamate-1-semialdehyde 2,1-aminomutase [Candidatus Methanomethylophilaceae archaeon]